MTSQRKGAEGVSHFLTGSEEQMLREIANIKKQYTSPAAKRYATTMSALTPLVLAAITDMRAVDDDDTYDIAKGMTQAFIGAALNILFNVYSADVAERLMRKSLDVTLPHFVEQAGSQA